MPGLCGLNGCGLKMCKRRGNGVSGVLEELHADNKSAFQREPPIYVMKEMLRQAEARKTQGQHILTTHGPSTLINSSVSVQNQNTNSSSGMNAGTTHTTNSHSHHHHHHANAHAKRLD